MKRRIIAAVSLGAAALASLAVLSIPAMVINTSVPAISAAETSTIHGSVSYRQRIALPQHAYLIVQLVDVSNPDGPFPVVSETSIQPKGQVPIAFALPVNNSKLQNGSKYALQARIVVGDILWFVSDERMPVNLTDKTANYAINLGMVAQTTTTKQTVPTVINGQEWRVEDIFGGGIIDSSHMTIMIDQKADNADNKDTPKYRVSGTGGCNRYFSSVTINEADQTLDFAPPAMTFMACAEAISQQESRFVEMMGKANSYTFDDIGRLFLKDADGNYIARLVPDL